MEQTLTLVVKIQPTTEQSSKLDKTLKAFADACNYINENTPESLTNKIAIQSLTYQTVKAEYGLVANMAVRAAARVAANRKAAKSKGRKVKQFNPTSMDLDKDLFRFIEKNWTVSLATVDGREKITLSVGNYQRGKLSGRQPKSAVLCKHGDGAYYLHIAITDNVPDPNKPDKVIGVDFGRRDIAVTSDGDSWNGKKIQDTRDKFNRVRASLQRKASKGTRSSRRRCRQLQQRLSGKERRYQQWLNHSISKRIVLKAKATNSSIAIEDLTGIRERTNRQPRNKTERRRSNSWAFYQLRQFLVYKAIQSGVELTLVNPAYTSQTCHCCLHIGLRSDKRFKCSNKACGWIGDADLNGAKNIALLGKSVTLAEGSKLLSCELSYDASGLLKAPCL